MVAEPAGEWKRLYVLLTRDTWDKRTAVFVIAGLDPAVDWLDPEELLAWLPGGLLPEWRGLEDEQVQRRAERAVMVAETRLAGLPVSVSVMLPILWLFEVMRRKQVQPHWADKPYIHPGIIPPWMPEARNQPGFELLIPPVLYPQAHRARQGHAGQPAAEQRATVRRMWDAWSLDGEGGYPDKAAFIESVLRALDRDSPDAEVNAGSIRNMIDDWERELFCPYGVIAPVDTAADTAAFRGYGPHAMMEPVKRPSRPRAPK